MSLTYPDLPSTMFPDSIDNTDRASDIAIEDLPLIDEYQRLFSSGKLIEASQYLQDHPQLIPKILNAERWNKLHDSIIALQRFCSSDVDILISKYLAAFGVTNGTSKAFVLNDIGVDNPDNEEFYLFDGALIRVKFHINTTSPFTINVKSSGNIPVFDTQGNNIDFKSGTWVTLIYSSSLNAWIAQNSGSSFSVSGVTNGISNAFQLSQDGFNLSDGVLIRIRFHTNTTSPFTINVSQSGAITACDSLGNTNINFNANTWASFIYSSSLNRWVAQGVGIKTVPTASESSNNDEIATTKFVKRAITSAISALNLYQIRVTFNPAYVGKEYYITSGDFSYNGIVPQSLTTTIPVPIPDTTYNISSNGVSSPAVVGTLAGIYPVSFRTKLNEYTWDEIAEISESGLATTYFNIGDEKDIILSTGERLTLQIYNFDNVALVSGGVAGITFGTKNLMATTRQLHDVKDESKKKLISLGQTTLYNWFKNDLYNSLPMKTLIKSVYRTANINNVVVNAKVFLPKPSDRIFINNVSRIKYLSNGTGQVFNWWTESYLKYYDDSFRMIVDTNGIIINDPLSMNRQHIDTTQKLGVAFCFCI